MLSEKLRQYLLLELANTETRAASHLERLTRVSHPTNRAFRRQMRQERKHARMLYILAGLPPFKAGGSDGQLVGDTNLGGLSAYRLIRLTYGPNPSSLPRDLQVAWVRAFEVLSLATYSLLIVLPIWSHTDRCILRQIAKEEASHVRTLDPLVHWLDRLKVCVKMLKGVLIFICTPME